MPRYMEIKAPDGSVYKCSSNIGDNIEKVSPALHIGAYKFYQLTQIAGYPEEVAREMSIETVREYASKPCPDFMKKLFNKKKKKEQEALLKEQLNNLSEKDKGLVDRSFGSSLFAIKLHSISGLSVDGTYNKKVDYDECTYIIDYEPNSKDRAINAMKEMNDYINNQALLELERLMREKAANGKIPTQEWVDQMRSQAIKNALPIKDYKLGKRFTDGLNGLLFNAVLNKQQY